MNPRHLLCLLALSLGALSALVSAAETPNFVIIFCDDQGYQDLGCYGSPNIDTPNIDQLAAEGIRFTNFYSAYCVCSASRVSLLTGSYQPRLSMPGVFGPRSPRGLHPDEITFADLLRTKGYATAMVGKWHVGDKPETLPTAQGFDTYFGLPYSNDMARAKGWGNAADDLDKIWAENKWDIYNNELYRDGEIIESPVNQVTLTDRYTEAAVDFIKAKKDQPFLVYLAHAMPHVPLFVPERMWDENPEKAYELVIEHIDESTGQILDTLEELGLTENTVVFYSSDNGPWLSKKHHGGSALPLNNGKTTVFEGGMRVPGIVRWPARIKPGQICDEVASTIDVLPTMAAITGAEMPADRPIDGRSILPLLDDPTTTSPHAEEGYFYYKNSEIGAVRVGDWKLHFQKNGVALFDLAKDLGETTNVAEQHPEVVAEPTKLAEAYDADLKANSRPLWGPPAPPKDKK